MVVDKEELGIHGSSAGKESDCNAGYPGLIPGSGRFAGKGIGYLLQYSWASLVAQLVKNLPAVRGTWVQSWVGKIPWRRERLPTPVFWPGEFYGLYSPWGHKELDMTERFSLSLSFSDQSKGRKLQIMIFENLLVKQLSKSRNQLLDMLALRYED